MGPGVGNPVCPFPTPSAGLPPPPSSSVSISTPKPFPRYGGFSLGGRDPDLPSGREVVRTVAEMRALLSPQPGNALDRILNNLTQWALGLDAHNSLKVGAGASRWWPGASKATRLSDLMALDPFRSGSTTRAGMPWWPL